MLGFNRRLQKIGLQLPEILLPASHVDMEKWPVVACDQFTSEPGYWREVDKLVSGIPSTRHLILPECNLENGGSEKTIGTIHGTMDRYLSAGLFRVFEPGVHLVVRKPEGKSSRTGLLVAIDLEKYDYSRDSVSPIRPTEGTIIERIPARKSIRAGASLELPHVMVLIDDPDRSIIEPLSEVLTGLPPVYTANLMKGGGSISAYRSESLILAESLVGALERLADPEVFKERYRSDQPFFVAIGDGNHSLAAAKSLWEDIKPKLAASARSTHPARLAMVEMVNIYDEGINFEPIHRLLFDIESQDFIDYCGRRSGALFTRKNTLTHLTETLRNGDDEGRVGFVSKGLFGVFALSTGDTSRTAEVVQGVIDEYLENHRGQIDYVHDMDTLVEKGSAGSNAGLIMPAIAKAQFFPYIIKHGCYPRKSFSLGESREKRYYMEARRIVPGV